MKTSNRHTQSIQETKADRVNQRKKTKRSFFTPVLMAFLGIIVLLPACFPQPSIPTPTEDIDSTITQIAQTIFAKFTQDAGSTAVAQLTLIARTPTKTPPPKISPTSALPSTSSPTPSNTPLLETSTPTPPSPPRSTVPCDQAQWLEDLSVPPDTVLTTGARFSKTWRVLNTGTCTWTTDYALVFTGGDRMGDITTFSLPQAVQSGAMVDLEVVLTLPNYPGIFQSYWMLRNPTGEIFGFGQDRTVPLQVRVRAIQSDRLPAGSYDFAANYCSADWRSATGQLACPDSNYDEDGGAILLNQPLLESGRSNQYALWTRPNQNQNGWISAIYPTVTIQEFDHFQAQVGCLADYPNCDVSFILDFQTLNGDFTNLGNWREIYDGELTNIDLNLSRLSGERGRFILTVQNNGSPQAANAVWLAPRLENLEPTSQVVLSWTHEGRQKSSCDELQIIITSPGAAEARASYCKNGQDFFVSSPLSVNELSQLLSWMQRLDRFRAEVFQANQVRPEYSWINFKGQGSETASNDDIQAINDFSTRLFERLSAGN